MNLRTSRPVAKLRQGRSDWYRIENKASGVASVYIYDEIGYFGITASDFVEDLNKITAKNIELHLNTPGGDVFDGITIYNALRDHDAEVSAIVDGLAASAGAFILQAGDQRTMNKGSQVMIHDAWGLAIGNADDLRDTADRLDAASDNIASIFADRSGQTVEAVREAMKGETWYNASEAVEFGLADETRDEDSEDKNKFDLSIYNHAGRDAAPAPVIPEAPKFDADNAIAALQRAFN